MKPLKLLFFTDCHVRGVSPVARKDNYLEAITEKLHWIIGRLNELAAEGPAVGILGGDLFDSPDASYSVTGIVAEILRGAQTDILTVPGNHDLWGYNPETLDRTPLGLFRRLGLVQMLTPKDGYVSIDHSVRITGRWFDWDVDKSIEDYAQKPASPRAAVRIHVVHGMAVEHPLPGMVRHTLLQPVPNTDLILTGHEHIGYGIKTHGGTVWVNPGALGRLTARIEEISRPIRVAIVTVPADAPFTVELLEVPHKPGPEVLSRDALRAEAAQGQRIAEFMDLLRAETAATRLLDVPALLSYLAQQQHMPEAIVLQALRQIERAHQDLLGRRTL